MRDNRVFYETFSSGNDATDEINLENCNDLPSINSIDLSNVEDFKQKRKELIDNYISEYNSANTDNKNADNTRKMCLLNSLLKNNKDFYEQKKKLNEDVTSMREKIKQNREHLSNHEHLYDKNESYNLIKKKRIISSNDKLKGKNLEYNIYLFLICVFVIIQVSLILII